MRSLINAQNIDSNTLYQLNGLFLKLKASRPAVFTFWVCDQDGQPVGCVRKSAKITETGIRVLRSESLLKLEVANQEIAPCIA